MSEHKKLARTLARAFYRHSSTRERLARAGNAKHDNTAIVEVLVDALTRRAWVREDDLAASVLLSAKQVRKALHYLEEQKLVTRAHVKEKDKERIARTRLRAEEQKVDDHVLNDRLNSVEKKVVTYVRLDYSRVVDAATLRIGTARRNLRRNIERGPASVLYRCVSEDDVCGKRYTSLDAARLLGAFCLALVPVRPRSRGARRSLRTFSPGVSPRPLLAFDPRPRRLSTPTDAFELHPDVASNDGTALRRAIHDVSVPGVQVRGRAARRRRGRRAAGAEDERGHEESARGLRARGFDRAEAAGQVRSIHWSPYDPVRVVDADP
jgi:transcription initiation factor IIE alpha subunit